MPWVIEESADCGVHWQRAVLTKCYLYPQIAKQEAFEIIRDEWRPPEHSLRQLALALEGESVAYYWERGIRVARRGRPAVRGDGR
jgi:hypothetical protein